MAQTIINNGDSGLVARTAINGNFSELYGLIGTSSSFSFVNSADDFPAAVAGVRVLPAGSAYYLTTAVDLQGDRIECDGKCAIVGSSPEISQITSTGLASGTALITSTFSLTLSNVQIEEVGTALDLNASSNSDEALDWTSVNFLNVDTVGTITTYDNFIGQLIGFLNSGGLTFAGTFETVGFDNSLFNAAPGTTVIAFDAAAVITRRFRVDSSSFVALAGETALSVPDTITIPTDGYILNGVNFSGGGTYQTGIVVDSLASNFNDCIGITNTTYAGEITMQGNATETVISSTGVAVKVLGTTVLNAITQKFTMPANNRLTYVGAQTKTFKVAISVSFTSNNNKKIGFFVAKNGSLILSSEAYFTSSNGSAALNVQSLVTMETDDYIELFVENDTDTSNVTVETMSMIITEQ